MGMGMGMGIEAIIIFIIIHYSHTILNAKHVNEANSINVGSNTSSLTTIRGVTPNNGIYVT